jgi:hypothetical protein
MGGMAVGWLFGCSLDVVVAKMRCEWMEPGTAVKGWGGENRDAAGCDQPCDDQNCHGSHGPFVYST